MVYRQQNREELVDVIKDVAEAVDPNFDFNECFDLLADCVGNGVARNPAVRPNSAVVSGTVDKYADIATVRPAA